MTEINKYHTSKIYKISSPQCEKFYIGSTIKTLNRRLTQHKTSYKRYIEKGVGSCFTSFEVVKFDDAIIELIKDVKCENRKELDKIEGDCILEYHDRILNKNIAGRTMKEWNEVNKEKLINWRKEYYDTNKNQINDDCKKYYEANKDIIKDKSKKYYYTNKNKVDENYKKYYEANKEKLIKKKREYLEANKEKLREKIECICGSKYSRCDKSTHNKTKKHQLYISTNQI
jgi:hypothetical protein